MPQERAGPKPTVPLPLQGVQGAVQGAKVDDETTPWLQILAQDPGRADAHRALYGIYRRHGDEERARSALSALCFLHQATSEEAAHHEQQQRAHRLLRSAGALSDDAWIGCVYRTDQSRVLSALSAILSGPLALRRALDARRYGLQPEERRAAAGEQTLFANVFSYAARLLGVATPDLCYRPAEKAPLRLANINEGGRLQLTVVVGQPLLSGVSEKELAFRCAVFLAKLRPEHLLRLLVPTLGELRLLLSAAVRLVAPDPAAPADPVVDAFRDQLRDALSAYGSDALERLARLVSSTPEPRLSDEGAWVQAVDSTALRAGLIACGDLTVALQVVTRDPADAGAMPVPTVERQKDLLRYAVSPRYHAARQFLGLG